MKKKTKTNVVRLLITTSFASLGYIMHVAGYTPDKTLSAAVLSTISTSVTCDNYRMQQYISSRSVTTHLSVTKIRANAESIYCIKVK